MIPGSIRLAPCSHYHSAVARHPPTRRRFFLRLLLALALSGVVLAGIAAFVALQLASENPEWWRPLNPRDEQTVEAAQTVEIGVTNALHQSRAAPDHAPEAWTLSVSEREVNAWLAARLRDWLANQAEAVTWPVELSEPQIDFREGKVAIGASFKRGKSVEVLAVTLLPRIDREGALWLTADDVSIGKLSIPASWALSGSGSLIRDRLPAHVLERPETKRILDVLAGKEPVTKNAILKLSDGRRVRVLGIKATDDALLVTCRTEPPEPEEGRERE